MYYRVKSPPDYRIHDGTILCYVRHECRLPVHGGGDADLPERPGDSSGQRHVHGLPDGLAIHCLLRKTGSTEDPHNYQLHYFSLFSQRRLHFLWSQYFLSLEPFLASSCRRLLTSRCRPLWRTWKTSESEFYASYLDTHSLIAIVTRHDRFFWLPLCKGKRRFKKSYGGNSLGISAARENKGFSDTMMWFILVSEYNESPILLSPILRGGDCLSDMSPVEN